MGLGPGDNWSIISWVLVSVFGRGRSHGHGRGRTSPPLLRESIEGRKQLKTDKITLFRRHY